MEVGVDNEEEETFSACQFAPPCINIIDSLENARSKCLLVIVYRSNVLILLYY